MVPSFSSSRVFASDRLLEDRLNGRFTLFLLCFSAEVTRRSTIAKRLQRPSAHDHAIRAIATSIFTF